MKCQKCQFVNREEATFCRKCGTALVFEILCRSCNRSNPPDSSFCEKCGHDLRTTIEFPSIVIDHPQSYTPKHLAEKILTTKSSIEGERKLVTVLFADVANYTAISEKLDPEEVHHIMDGCFKILMDEIHKFEGTINQFTGDGVMALFGAPVAHEDHAQRACYASLSIQKAVMAYGERIKKDTGVDFAMRLGLNSGPVIVGSIGDDLRMDYTAVGDTTNLASRMEGIAEPGTIMVSSNTQRLVRDFFEFESRGEIDLKGKKDPQQAYELIKIGEITSRIGASVAKGLTRFVGRKKSMVALIDAYEKAKSGSGQVVAIVGEAGVGKSRLLLELRQRLPQDDIIYLEGRCIHYGGSMAYLPILDILRAYFEIQDGDREFLIKKKMEDKVASLDSSLNNLLPFFQELLSLSVDDTDIGKLEPKIKREKTFEALRDLFIRTSHHKPLALVVEDLHWVDKTSEDFLDYLIGWLGKNSILMILLYRPEYTHHWSSKTFYTKIGLDQLGPASSGELIKAILEEGDVAPELKQLILDRAAGNPLFLEEFTHTLIENGTIEKNNDRYALKIKSSDIQVPDTIQGIISARMDRLEDNIKRTMQVASVIGRDFSFRILKTITGMRDELNSYLLNLQGMEFIYEKRLFPELEYIFKHALIQEVAYNSLLIKRRSEIHLKIAQAIETLYAERIEEHYEVLAYHYLKNENWKKAYHYLTLAGKKAVENFANNEALAFYYQALEVLTNMPQSKENKQKNIDLRVNMRPPFSFLGWPEGSLKNLTDAETMAREIGDNRRLALVYGQISNYYFNMGRTQQAIGYSEKGLIEAEKSADIDLPISIGIELALGAMKYGNFEKAVQVSNKLITMIEENHKEMDFFERPHLPYAELHGLHGAVLAYQGQVGEAEASGRKGLRIAQDSEHLPTIALAEFYLATISFGKYDGQKIIKHAQTALQLFAELGITVFQPLCYYFAGAGYHLLADDKTAAEYVNKALQMQTEMGLQLFLSLLYTTNAAIETDLGNVNRAKNCAQKALELAQKNDERPNEIMAWYQLGAIFSKFSPADFDKAEQCILTGIKIARETKFKPRLANGFYCLGDLYSQLGRKEDALAHLKKAETMFKEMEIDYYLEKIQDALNRL